MINTHKGNIIESPIDYPSALKRAGGDASFLEELLDLFVKEFSKKYSLLLQAIQKKNFGLIHEIAHSLKGSSANLGLVYLQEVSSQLEFAGKVRDLKRTEESLAHLKEEFERFRAFLEEDSPKD